MVRELIGTDLGGQTMMADETRQRLVKLLASVMRKERDRCVQPWRSSHRSHPTSKHHHNLNETGQKCINVGHILCNFQNKS